METVKLARLGPFKQTRPDQRRQVLLPQLGVGQFRKHGEPPRENELEDLSLAMEEQISCSLCILNAQSDINVLVEKNLRGPVDSVTSTRRICSFVQDTVEFFTSKESLSGHQVHTLWKNCNSTDVLVFRPQGGYSTVFSPA